MSYNILNKNVKFQGVTQGTIEDIVDLHSDQTVGGKKTITNLTGTYAKISNDLEVTENAGIGTAPAASAQLSIRAEDSDNRNYALGIVYNETTVATNRYALNVYAATSNGINITSPENGISSAAKYNTLEQTQNGGYGLYVSRNIAEGGSSPLVNFVNDNANNIQATLRLKQDGTGDLLQGNYQGSTIFKINRSGSIGIQTTHPEAELHVVGQVTCSLGITASAFHGSGVSLTGVTTALKSGGGLAYSSNELTIDMSSVTDAGSTINSTDEVLITQGGNLKKIDATRIASLFQQTITGYTQAGNNRIITSVDSDEIQGEPNLTFDGSSLEVVGAVSASSTLQVGGNITGNQSLEIKGDLTIDTDTLHVKSSSNRVGIGTTSPDALLDLKGSGAADSELLRLSLDGDRDWSFAQEGSGAGTGLRLRSTAGKDFHIDATSTVFRNYNGSGEIMRVEPSNSRVGIGVTDPDSTLEILSTSAQFKLSYDGSNAAAFVVDSSGKLTLTPNGGLDVDGNIILKRNVTIGDASGDAVTINAAAISTPNGLNFDSNTLVIDQTNNRVGVGVADPDQSLEVAGAVHISGEISSPSAPSDGDGGVLYVKSDGKIYWVSNELSETDLTAGAGTDIDALPALGGTGLHQTQDHFMFSDNGTEKKITFSNLEDAIFANVSGDATIAAGGALTVADSVATGLAGDGLVASSGVMAVQVQGALKISSDAIGITGSIAGNGLQAAGTADAVSSLAVSVDNSTIEINSDSLRLKDNGVTLAKMAGLARGKIIVGDSSGDPTSLTLGSAGQLLVSDGDDLLYRSLGGDASLGADGTLTITANAVEGSMLNSNVAGSGLDYGSNQLSVDVSDFMANGVDNRVLTATGADAMTGEANLTFDGSLLTVAGTGSATKLRANYTGGGHTDAVFLISGSNTENLFQIMQQGNGYPTSFLAGENHSLYPGLLYNRGKIANGGTISQGNVEGAAGSHTRLTVRKTSIADNTATSIVTITVPNANHAAAIRVFGLANFDNCNYAQSFSFEGSLARGSGSPVDKAFSSVTAKENAGITPNFTIAVAGSANTGANSATQTFDLQLTIDTSDGSSSNATIMIELINFNDSGITMAAS